jgi:hypothetical protein
MKLYLCETKSGTIKKMTLSKVIKRKRENNPVKIIGFEEIKKRG